MKKNKQRIKYKDALNLENVICPSLKRYNENIADLILEYFKKGQTILDFGAGTGHLAKIISEKSNENPSCIEIDEDFQKILKKKGFKVQKNLDETNESFDLIYSSNVLEHIYNDVEILISLKSKLKDNGTIVLYLPAFNILFSDLDRKVGHFRRYSKSSILKKALNAGLKVKRVYYVDSIGFFGSLVIRLFGWNTKDGIGSKKSLVFYDRFIFPISIFFDKVGFKHFLGKNIYISLKK